MPPFLLDPKNIAEIRIENYDRQGEWWYVLITSLSIACSFIACGSWCIYAARKIKEEESVYHFEGEFMPDDENPSKSRKSKKASSQEASARSNAGSDTSGIEIGEQHGQEKEQERHKGYFKTLARSLIP